MFAKSVSGRVGGWQPHKVVNAPPTAPGGHGPPYSASEEKPIPEFQHLGAGWVCRRQAHTPSPARRGLVRNRMDSGWRGAQQV